MEGPFDGKVATDAFFPVRLLDSATGAEQLAVDDESVEVYYSFDGSQDENQYALGPAYWFEIGHGNYHLGIGAGEFAMPGLYTICVLATDCVPYVFGVNVRSLMPEEVNDLVESAVDENGRVNVGEWLDEPVEVGTETGLPKVDVEAIGDALENAEALAAMLDGTGAILYLTGLIVAGSDPDGAMIVSNSAGPGVVFGSAAGHGLVLESTGGNGDGLSLSGNGTGQAIQAAVLELLADTILKRSSSHTEAEIEASGELDCLAYVPLAMRRFNLTANPGYLTVYQSDGVTELCRIAIATNVAASPIVGAGP